MTPAETIERLEAVRFKAAGAWETGYALHINLEDLEAIESALAALRDSQSAREKAAREAAGVCKRILLSRCYNSEEKLAALSCEAAILKHFDLEAK